MRITPILAALFAGFLAIAADDKPAVKEIPTKDLKLNVTIPKGGKVTNPHIVTSATDLPKITAFTPDAVEALRKQVDFDKEQLVVFWWAGSGQDKLTAGEVRTIEKKTIVDKKEVAEKRARASFTYTPGKTRDLRAHFHLFVVPKWAEVAVGTAK